jgi:hypothetical protein
MVRGDVLGKPRKSLDQAKWRADGAARIGRLAHVAAHERF